MTAQSIGLTFESIVGIVFLLIVLFHEYPKLRLDEFREKMFAIRAELFDFAVAGNIQFSHPAYLLLRQSINGFIRYGHQITLFRICMNMLIWKTTQYTPKLEWTKSWEQALNSIEDEDAKRKLIDLHNCSSSLVAERLVLGSPVLLGFLSLCIGIAIFQVGWDSLRTVIRKASKQLTSRIIDPRILDEEAARSAAAA